MLLAAVAGVGLFGCGGGGGGGGGLARLRVSDAETLFIVPGSAAARGAASLADAAAATNTLFKITPEGVVMKVDVLDEGGDVIDSRTMEPRFLLPVDADYFIVVFHVVTYNESMDAYLVRKTDGAVFSLVEVGTPQQYSNWFGNGTGAPVQRDASGNLYFALPDRIVRIDVSDPANLTASTAAPDAQFGGSPQFSVDKNGNVAFTQFVSVGVSQARIAKRNGGLYNLPAEDYWTGLDGFIYFPGSEGAVKRVRIDDAYVVNEEEYGRLASGVIPSGNTSFTVTLADRMIRIQITGGTSVHEIYGPGGPRDVASVASLFSSIRHAASSDGFYYIAGNGPDLNPVMYRVNPTTDAATRLLEGYEVRRMVVSPDDVVTFNAVRMQDGAKVLGRVAADGAVTILESTIDQEIVELMRVQ